MDAHRTYIADVFNTATLIEIPFFQRSYVWDEELWKRFLDDMEYVVTTKKPYFLGAIILKEGRRPVEGDDFTSCLTVVDGQQRLTTLLIFFKVLCLKLDQMSTFDIQFRIRGKAIALHHGKNDIAAFEKVMESTALSLPDDSFCDSRIVQAFNYFVEQVNIRSFVASDINTICSNIQFVRINLTANEDEQQIFNTINSLGVDLTTSELLKNYFFSRETIREYEESWASVFEKDSATKAYWDTVIEVGRVRRALIDIFFDAYFQIFIQDKKYNISNEDKITYGRLDKLAQSYQHFVKNYCNGDKAIVLAPMKEYAQCFMRSFRPEFCKMNTPGGYGIERLNVIIFGLRTSTLIPYILYIAKNVLDQDERNRIYGVLESYILRRVVVCASTKNYNNFFTSLILNKVLSTEALISKIKNSNDATTYFPDDNELQNGFQTSKLVNLQSRGILYLIETYIHPSNSATALLGFDGYSLEHLMPKKWRNHWPACSSEEEERKRDALLLTLGNLAIIPQSLNASIRDGEWKTKKAGKSNKPGLEICAAGLETMRNVLQKTDWNETDIQERAEWLFDRAVLLWKI